MKLRAIAQQILFILPPDLLLETFIWLDCVQGRVRTPEPDAALLDVAPAALRVAAQRHGLPGRAPPAHALQARARTPRMQAGYCDGTLRIHHLRSHGKAQE